MRVLFTFHRSPVSQEGTHKVVMRPPHATTERPVTIAVPQQATPLYNSITVCVDKSLG